MGWSKRGNGKNYDSLNGYGAIIGFLTGKILDYATRNRKCSKCDAGHTEDHDCRKNFVGSAKAMESDAGASLINNSSILQEVGLKVRVVIGDDDSSTMCAEKKDNFETIHKLSDKNHLIKNYGKDLYELSKSFKELKTKGVIPHLKKCFSYAVAQNKGKSKQLAIVLRSIPNHIFGHHENCGDWCSRNDKSEDQTIKLTGKLLHNKLDELFSKYAANSSKFSVSTSSQSNESINNMIAHKLPKNICYSKSAAADFRVASAVCAKNEGESSLLEITEKLSIEPGTFTKSYVSKADKIRKNRATKALEVEKKLR